MQAEVVPLSKSGVPAEDIIPAPADSVSIASALEINKKSQEKKPLKIDFSAFCDCV